jgi:hypothetical protein
MKAEVAKLVLDNEALVTPALAATDREIADLRAEVCNCVSILQGGCYISWAKMAQALARALLACSILWFTWAFAPLVRHVCAPSVQVSRATSTGESLARTKAELQERVLVLQAQTGVARSTLDALKLELTKVGWVLADYSALR